MNTDSMEEEDTLSYAERLEYHLHLVPTIPRQKGRCIQGSECIAPHLELCTHHRCSSCSGILHMLCLDVAVDEENLLCRFCSKPKAKTSTPVASNQPLNAPSVSTSRVGTKSSLLSESSVSLGSLGYMSYQERLQVHLNIPEGDLPLPGRCIQGSKCIAYKLLLHHGRRCIHCGGLLHLLCVDYEQEEHMMTCFHCVQVLTGAESGQTPEAEQHLEVLPQLEVMGVVRREQPPAISPTRREPTKAILGMRIKHGCRVSTTRQMLYNVLTNDAQRE
jgi:hypothetical protein